jgi:hypothetical protein
MTSKRILFLPIALVSLALPVKSSFGQILNSKARIVVPQQSEGWAALPLFNSYPTNRLFTTEKANLRIQHDADSITCDLTMPVAAGYVAPAPLERDSLRILQESGLKIEILLQPGKSGPYYYYGVNSGGGLYDAKGDDKAWNGNAEITMKLEPNVWHVQLKVPYADLGLNPAQTPQIGANVLLESKNPADRYVATWTAVGSDFTNTGLFGTLELGQGKPFVSAAKIKPATYNTSGAALAADFTISNPTAQEVTFGEGTARVSVPARGKKAVTQTVPLASEKLSGVTFALNDTFAYSHQIPNEMMPDVELLLQDLSKFRLGLRNRDFLRKYVSNVRVFIDGKVVCTEPLAAIEKRDFSLQKLALGDHELKVVLLSQGTKEVSRSTIPFYKFDPPKIDGDITKLDVSKYYKPIGFDGKQLKAARSSFDLGRGTLPQQIAVNDVPILAAPIAIRFNGKDLVENAAPKVVLRDKNRYGLASTGKVDAANASIAATYDYDGFTWYDVKIKGGQPLAYGPLEIVIPLKLAKDVLLTRSAPLYDEQFAKTGFTDGKYEQKYQGRSQLLTEKSSEWPMSSVISLATDENEQYRGLSFVTEGPKGWNLKNYDSMYHIERDDAGNATLTVRVSDGQTAWKQDEIAFSFGIQPFPMRPYPVDAHRFYRLDNTFDPNDYQKRYENAKRTGEQTFFERLKAAGATTEVAFEYWTEYENYWKTNLRDTDLKYYVRDAHENDRKVLAYFGFLMSDQIPEFPLYHDLALNKPSKYPNEPGFEYYKHYNFGTPGQQAYNVCYNSFWGDTQLHGIEEAVKRYNFDGVYLDSMMSPAVCANFKHGCGLIDPYGRVIVTSPIRAIRRMGEQIFALGQRRSKDFMIDIHISEPCPPLMGLATGFYTGETMHLFDPQYSRMEPGAMRAWLNGKMYGLPVDLLLRPPYYQNVGWAQTLLVDSQVRLAMGGGDIWTGLAQRMWNLDKTYGMTADTFTPYFSGKNKIKTDNPKVLVSYYDTPKAIIAVVSSYWSEVDEDVTVDLSGFAGLKSTQVKDLWRNEETFAIEHGKVTFPMPGLNLRLLLIEKTP